VVITSADLGPSVAYTVVLTRPDALVRLFSRRMTKLGLRTPQTTPHALRHSHATAMWEGGMRELSLQKRLGHASPESTKVYTRVSDEAVLADYTRALEKNR
jgi:integrase